jgi:hypothetical protein
MQLRNIADEERAKSSKTEAALEHWQQRHEATSSMLQAEQQLRQRENQAAGIERQRLMNEQWKQEGNETQLKIERAAALQRCEELAHAIEAERAAAALQRAEQDGAHALEVSQLKKALADMQGARVDAGRDLQATQELLRQLQHDHEHEKGILAAAIKTLQNNVELLQAQLQVRLLLLLMQMMMMMMIMMMIFTFVTRLPKIQMPPPTYARVTNTPNGSMR